MTDIIRPVTEPQAAEFAKANDTPPFLYQSRPTEDRKAVDEAQSGDINNPAIDEEWVAVEGGPKGSGGDMLSGRREEGCRDRLSPKR